MYTMKFKLFLKVAIIKVLLWPFSLFILKVVRYLVIQVGNYIQPLWEEVMDSTNSTSGRTDSQSYQ